MAKKPTPLAPLLPGAAKTRYEQLKQSRSTALERARANSKLTIPGLVPEDGQDSQTGFDQPYQSLGARMTNNLASWLLVTQFPPDAQFFKLAVHEDTADELGSKLSEVNQQLSRIGSKAQLLMETSASRPVFMEVLRHLIIAGNCLLYLPLEPGPPRMFRIDQYVIIRNPKGELLEAVVHEKVYPSSLEAATIAACKVTFDPGKENEKLIDLYTHIRKDGENLTHYQEINNTLVPGSEGTSPYASRGWIALRWSAVPGSDWGRAYVSEYMGDLLSLEDLSKAIVEFAGVASRIIYMVDPNAMIDIEELNAAESGDYVTGYRDRIQTLSLDKGQDFSVVNSVVERIETRLSNAFLLRSGTVRNAERVTAEEIRAMAQELENVLGGTYTVLSAEFQLPLVNRLLYILMRNGDAPELPASVRPVVITGFAAMGRNHAANKMRAAMADLTAMVGPEAAAKLVDAPELARRLFENYGIEDIKALIKDADTVAADAQAEQTNAAAQSAVPEIAKGVVQTMTQPDQG